MPELPRAICLRRCYSGFFTEMNRALFIDRDGVINRKGGPYYISRIEDFVFNRGIFAALKAFSSAGYKIIVITNQGGIAKECHTEVETLRLHDYMVSKLAEEGVAITAVYYCPHHPDVSECLCRKPGNLLFETAIHEHQIDRKKSLMIGDSEIDIEAAAKSGIRGIRVKTNSDLTTIEGLCPGE
jgi:D-glycero-D-manno-heptose 1,7-bisphosphate phosphatase